MSRLPAPAGARTRPRPPKEKKPTAYSEHEFYRRALKAYFRGSKGVAPQPSDHGSGVYTEVRGKGKGKAYAYAVLANVNGVLAVYRTRNTGMLKRLARCKYVGE